MSTALPDELQRFLRHLEVERRVAVRTLVLYRSALAQLDTLATAAGVELRQAQTHHIRRWMTDPHPLRLQIDLACAGQRA